MCDQNEMQILECDPRLMCQPCDYSSGDQFVNADSCGNCEETNYCPPECNQCFIPQNQTSDQQCYQQSQACYEPCQPAVCYQEAGDQSQQYEVHCDPCPPQMQRCDPCEPFGPQQMPCEQSCRPRYPCKPPCSPNCSPFSRKRYVQPARRESCKPLVRYQRPCVPMTSDTIYRKSFDCIDSKTAAACRMAPVMPNGQLRGNCGEFAKETVTKLSYQPFCCPDRTKPIYPNSPSLLGQGPMQGLTTQKHDFVPKFQFRRSKCAPNDNIGKACGCVERSTIQKLSFMPPNSFTRAQSCKPIVSYKPPELPMEFETTQKLSFMPVCPAPKEDMPWARKASYCRPSIQFAKDTVAKLSYQPPGCFIDDCSNDCCYEVQCDDAPRASC